MNDTILTKSIITIIISIILSWQVFAAGYDVRLGTDTVVLAEEIFGINPEQSTGSSNQTLVSAPDIFIDLGVGISGDNFAAGEASTIQIILGGDAMWGKNIDTTRALACANGGAGALNGNVTGGILSPATDCAGASGIAAAGTIFYQVTQGGTTSDNTLTIQFFTSTANAEQLQDLTFSGISVKNLTNQLSSLSTHTVELTTEYNSAPAADALAVSENDAPVKIFSSKRAIALQTFPLQADEIRRISVASNQKKFTNIIPGISDFDASDDVSYVSIGAYQADISVITLADIDSEGPQTSVGDYIKGEDGLDFVYAGGDTHIMTLNGGYFNAYTGTGGKIFLADWDTDVEDKCNTGGSGVILPPTNLLSGGAIAEVTPSSDGTGTAIFSLQGNTIALNTRYDICFDANGVTTIDEELKQITLSYTVDYFNARYDNTSFSGLLCGSFNNSLLSDTVAPVITAPDDLMIITNDPVGVMSTELRVNEFINSVTGYDNVDINIDINSDAPMVFPLGDTIVTFSATDNAGNIGIAEATVSILHTGGDADSDGVLNIDDTFPLDPEETADTDADGIGNNADTDDDADGILDVDDSAPLDNSIGDTENPVIKTIAELEVEATGPTTDIILEVPTVTDNNINSPTITSDYAGPLDLGSHEITWTAVDFAGNSSSAVQVVTIVDTTSPEFPETVDLTLDAVGKLTDISESVDVIATDLVDGEIQATIDAETLYKSGRHSVQLSAIDVSDNESLEVLTVNINPVARLGLDKDVEAGASVNIPVYLSGKAAIYPAFVDYEITGNTITKSTAELVIDEGVKGQIAVDISANAAAGDEVVLTLTSGVHTIPEQDSSVTYTVVVDNLPPVIGLEVMQSDNKVSVIDADAGMVTVLLEINDVNINDTHTVVWTVDGSAFVDLAQDSDDLTFEFAPSTLADATYGLNVTVTESNTSEMLAASLDIHLPVNANLPQLSDTEDSDGDGVSNANEGYSDSDGDGIADYLDNDEDTSYLSGGDHSYLQTLAGLSLSIGNVVIPARGVNVENAELNVEELASYGGPNGSNASNSTDVHFERLTAIINFVVSGLSNPGDTAPVVINLGVGKTIPEDAIYRKYIDAVGWFNFMEDDNNSIASAMTDANGNCPAPLAADFLSGLNTGDNCIQLIIEDGGANDADAYANATIEDPGVLAIELENGLPEVSIMAHDGTYNEGGTVSLTSESSDPENDELTFRWEQVSGPAVSIEDVTATAISFTAPEVSSAEIIELKVTVSDGRDSSSATTSLTVNNVVTPPAPTPEPGKSSGGGSVDFVTLLLIILSMGYYRRRTIW